MKKLLIPSIMLLVCLSFTVQMSAGRHSVKRYLTKEITVDLSQMNHIFVSWVDMHDEDWGAHGYTTKEEWANVISSLNAGFGSNLIATYLPGKNVVMAKSKDAAAPADSDLIIKFSDVRVDYDNYHLILAIHFVDPKTNKEIGLIPVRPYYGNDWGLRGYLNEALKEVGIKIRVEITGSKK
jgi:hypothetical protein